MFDSRVRTPPDGVNSRVQATPAKPASPGRADDKTAEAALNALERT
jgi:hypothetical protein